MSSGFDSSPSKVSASGIANRVPVAIIAVVALSTKPAKTRVRLSLILALTLLAWPVFVAPARASNAPNMDKALAHLLEAQSATDETQEAAALNGALQSLNRATNKQKGPALVLVQTAISDLGEHDTGKVNDDITQAIAAIQKAVGTSADSPTPAKTDQTNPFGIFVPAVSFPAHTAPAAALSADQARAIVILTGDNAEGTGFLVKTPNGPAVVTSLHVIANNPNLKVTTNTGALITVLSAKGASDRDLAMLAVQDAGYAFLQMADDISQIVQPGDQVITPGKSQGSEVVRNTAGKILGIGPVQIDFDNSISQGNSGGPVIHVKSGKVLGVVTQALNVDVSNALDKAPYASRASPNSSLMRYFGLRLDTVTDWVAIDSQRFQVESAFFDRFEKRSRCLDCYLNAPHDNKPQDLLYEQDDKVVKANDDYLSNSAGVDNSQQQEALRQWLGDMYDLANSDMEPIQNADSFYSFDRQRARDEIAYRKALKTELDSRSDDLTQLATVPRKNS